VKIKRVSLTLMEEPYPWSSRDFITALLQ